MKWMTGAGELYKPLVLSAPVALDQRHLVGTDEYPTDLTQLHRVAVGSNWLWTR